MRNGLLIALIVWGCGWAAPASAQVALVSGQTVASASGSMWISSSEGETLSLPGSVTVGNTVVAWTLFADSRRTMSCTHDGNAMTQILTDGSTSSSGDPTVMIFARVATTTGTGVTCTINIGEGNGSQGFAVAEFSGLAGTLSTQGGAGVNATTAAETAAVTSHDSGADLTPDTTHNLMVGGILCSGGTINGLDGYTALISSAAKDAGYLIQSSATAGDWVPTTDVNRSCEVGLQNLDGAAVGAPTCRGGSMLLGAGGPC